LRHQKLNRMKIKKKSLKSIPSILIALIIVAGAFMKLFSAPPLITIYSKIGLLPYIQALGVAEILFVVLFLYSRTIRIGLLLLTGYLGGAMAVELSHGTVFIFPALLLSVVWISAYLRESSLFLTVENNSMIIGAHQKLTEA
jgi:hypothetical protein